MATSSSPEVHSNFLTKSELIRTQIKSNFNRLTQRVNKRRNDLLKRLQEVETRYKQLAEESEQALNKLEDLKQNSKEILNMNLLNSFQNKVQNCIDDEITELGKEMHDMDVKFEWDETVERLLSDLGTLCIQNVTRDYIRNIDYSSKLSPVISTDFLESCHAQGVCVDRNTSSIYISNRMGVNSSVDVYDREGELLLRIGEQDKTMDSPYGIAVHNDKIYISQYTSSSILKYQYFQSTIPKKTSTLSDGRGELKNPTLLSIDESNSHVYVCDTGNKRIVRYSKYLKFHSYISGREELTPSDVKLSENYIYILFTRDWRDLKSKSYQIGLYSKNEGYPLQKTVLLKGTLLNARRFALILT